MLYGYVRISKKKRHVWDWTKIHIKLPEGSQCGKPITKQVEQDSVFMEVMKD